MGQLEKYGLYVLCLVIFLILGVTIWGEGSLQPADRRSGAGAGAELSANGPGGAGGKSSKPAQSTGTMAALLDPKNAGKDPKHDPKSEPKPVVSPPPASGVASGDPKQPEAGKPTDKPTDPANSQPVQPLAETVRPTRKVQGGDTFESIAKQLGSASLRTELQRLNPRVEPTRMRTGLELQLPTKAEIDQFLARGTAPKVATAAKDAAAKEPTAKDVAAKDAAANKAGTKAVTPVAGKATYTVAKGDTFEGIATRQLGSKKRLDELLELNPSVRPTGLKVGQKILLPKK